MSQRDICHIDKFVIMAIDDKMHSMILYTKDYEWVEFCGGIAYTGICEFKLTGFKDIHHLDIFAKCGPRKENELLATIRYNEYQIDAHMPVDGKILRLNECLITSNYKILLEDPEGEGWIAEFIPDNHNNTKNLLPVLQYRF